MTESGKKDMKKLHGVLLKHYEGHWKTEEVDVKIDRITELLGCEVFDTIKVKFGNHTITVFCDDMCLINNPDNPSLVITKKGSKEILQPLTGNLFFCIESRGLTKEEVEAITETHGFVTNPYGRISEVLVCESKY